MVLKIFFTGSAEGGTQNQKYQLETPVQFGRRAARRRGGKLDFSLLAAGLRFERRLRAPKAPVLPLDDPAM